MKLKIHNSVVEVFSKTWCMHIYLCLLERVYCLVCSPFQKKKYSNSKCTNFLWWIICL